MESHRKQRQPGRAMTCRRRCERHRGWGTMAGIRRLAWPVRPCGSRRLTRLHRLAHGRASGRRGCRRQRLRIGEARASLRPREEHRSDDGRDERQGHPEDHVLREAVGRGLVVVVGPTTHLSHLARARTSQQRPWQPVPVGLTRQRSAGTHLPASSRRFELRSRIP